MSILQGFITGFARSADESIKKYLESDNQLKSKLAEKRIARGEVEEARHREDNQKYLRELKGLAKKAGGTDNVQYILDKFGYDEGVSIINSLYTKAQAGGKPINQIFKLSQRVGASPTVQQLADFYTPPIKMGSGESMKGVGGGISKMFGGENWIQKAVLKETDATVGKLTTASLQDVPEALTATDDIEDYEIGYSLDPKQERTRLMGVADNFLKAGNIDKASRIKIVADANYLTFMNSQRSEYSDSELKAVGKKFEKDFVSVHNITGSYDAYANFKSAKDSLDSYEHALEKTAELTKFAQEARKIHNINPVDINLALTNAITKNLVPIIETGPDAFSKPFIKLTDRTLFTVGTGTQSTSKSKNSQVTTSLTVDLKSEVPSTVANIVASSGSAQQLAILNAKKKFASDSVALSMLNKKLSERGL